MEKNNTKQQILNAALELFSVQGYEATSISQLAESVGIRKASLYSHFENKQDILDTLVDNSLEEYNKHSVFANSNWEDEEFTKDFVGKNPEELSKVILGQVRFVIHDPVVSKARKMLVIEQFINPKLSKLHSKQNFDDVIHYCEGMIRFLIKQGYLIDMNPAVMAVQFSSPITVLMNLCDREPEREKEAIELIERHIKQFFDIYKCE